MRGRLGIFVLLFLVAGAAANNEKAEEIRGLLETMKEIYVGHLHAVEEMAKEDNSEAGERVEEILQPNIEQAERLFDSVNVEELTDNEWKFDYLVHWYMETAVVGQAEVQAGTKLLDHNIQINIVLAYRAMYVKVLKAATDIEALLA